MIRPGIYSCALALACLCGISAAQAGPISFTYDWSQSSTLVGGATSQNAIVLAPQGPVVDPFGAAVGNVASLSVQNANSDTFSNAPFQLTVKITDGGQPGMLTFNGAFNGMITDGVVNSLSVTYSSPTTQSLGLGTDQFSVSITGLVPPSPYGEANNPGCIGFQITSTGGTGTEPPPPNNVPEPTSLLLSWIGVGMFAFRAWRNRNKETAQS